jgi:hypothetical protein
MLNIAPPINSAVTYTLEGGHKPKTWKGEVIAHVHDEDGSGVRVLWPTMKYRKEKGCTVFHEIPSPWLKMPMEAKP